MKHPTKPTTRKHRGFGHQEACSYINMIASAELAPRPTFRRAYRGALAPALLAALCSLSTGCTADDELTIPNRVLDRPMDMVLSCVEVSGDDLLARPRAVEDCEGYVASGLAVTCDQRDTPQLVGFVANSERNEVAMFSSCSNRLVDMDTDSPGYNFIPVGALPSSLTTTDDGCRVVTSNYGSCDLSVLDVPPLAGYALDARPEGPPSSYVSRIVPTTSDGNVLAARPGEVISVPNNLSLSQLFAPDDGVETDPGLAGQCNLDSPSSIYVTFPGCQMIAELDLQTQLILQSRQFVTEEDGSVTVIDSGTAPKCPVDCPELLPEGVTPTPGEGVLGGAYDPNGVFPSTLSLVSPLEIAEGEAPPTEEANPDIKITDNVLYVGGVGSDYVFSLAFDDDGYWADEAVSKELVGARGVTRVRPTPVMSLPTGSNSYYQFLYVIAGDGSTRVLSRDLDAQSTVIGTECDTQSDPREVASPAYCNEAPEISPDLPVPDRRAFANGPGLRVPFSGSVVTDWTFQRVSTSNDNEGVDENPEENDDVPVGAVIPEQVNGVLGIGVTNAGRVVLANFGHFPERNITSPSAVEAVDPLGTMDLTVFTHTLWPVADPYSVVNRDMWPTMRDIPPTRVIAGDIEGAL
ncbi:MAG: hypothetical protein ACPG4T_10120, partial [Nannocystaceae bacterium]